MNPETSHQQKPHQRILSKPFLIASGVFILSLLWFWFWRPYGYYGGDSEFLDRQVNNGLWFRKREVLAVAAMQLSRQIFTLQFDWPVSWSISMVSCLAGSVSVTLAWLLCRNEDRGALRFILILTSGYMLLYHGSVESYALPTAALMFWIYAIHQVDRGRWHTSVLPFSFALMAWCHLMALFLFPSLLVSAWVYRERVLGKDLKHWILAGLATFGIYIFTVTLRFGSGQGVALGDLFFKSDRIETQEVGTFLSMEHLRIKSYFLWLGTHVTVVFALAALWKERTNRVVLQIGGMVIAALIFLIFFHPDCGYKDWDLFLLPSLPAAVLGSRWVVQSKWRHLFATIWILAFLTLWFPRIPVWARLSERGLAKVEITNHPMDRQVRFDGRYLVRNQVFYTQGGEHKLEVRKRGYKTYYKHFEVSPGDSIQVEVPIVNEEVPMSEEIRKILEEIEEEKRDEGQ
ncbi:MAG: carboxypeptidase regulatory-like domain-containing protein [Candidatus Omnitrophica bacterium]|nr:carboxypeptidase regulatory-like domain-containing protein [Candidatus Omnitrophota bacterium]